MPERILKKVFEEIERLLKHGDRTYVEIAATVGVEQSIVCTIAKGKHFYQCNVPATRSQPIYMPTPKQIESECARLRAERPPSKQDDPDGWTPPVVSPGTLD